MHKRLKNKSFLTRWGVKKFTLHLFVHVFVVCVCMHVCMYMSMQMCFGVCRRAEHLFVGGIFPPSPV